MARFDIMPFASPLGGHTEVISFAIGIGVTNSTEDTSWRAGNIVTLDAAVGDINPHTDGTLAPDNGLSFIAAVDSAGIIQKNNLASPVVAGGIAMVPVYPVTGGQEFVTANVYNADDTELNLDTGFQIGDVADFWVDDATATLDGHKHGLNIAGNGFVITRKLDALGRDSLVSGAATVKVVFRFNSRTAA